jgi:hypothetical protein
MSSLASPNSSLSATYLPLPDTAIRLGVLIKPKLSGSESAFWFSDDAETPHELNRVIPPIDKV